MIRVQDLSFKRGGKEILSKLNFQAAAGEISVILGKNGAGKSTVLNCLCGNFNDYEGTINWDGQDLKNFSLKEQAKRRAVLAQSMELSFQLSVYDVIEMGCYGQYDRFSSKERRQLIEEVANQFQLSSFLDRDFLSLSGGEKKRVLLAKCLIQLKVGAITEKRQYLLLDEPTAALDLEQQNLLLQFIKELVRKEGLGVIAVLHDLNLAAQLADQLILLKQGKVHTCGSPEQVLQPAIIQDVFDIDCLIQRHPSLDCPLITTLPYAERNSTFAPATGPTQGDRTPLTHPAAS
ncbi:MAG: heme ABC transporter ATP-binding protein [Bacteroidota bacterium]